MVRQAVRHWMNRKQSGYWTEVHVCSSLSWIHAKESWESTATEQDQIKICVRTMNRQLSITGHIHKLR